MIPKRTSASPKLFLRRNLAGHRHLWGWNWTPSAKASSLGSENSTYELSPAGTAENYPGRQSWAGVLRLRPVPQDYVLKIFRTPWQDASFQKSYPALRAGLLSAVPAGLNSVVQAFLSTLFRAGGRCRALCRRALAEDRSAFPIGQPRGPGRLLAQRGICAARSPRARADQRH